MKSPLLHIAAIAALPFASSANAADVLAMRPLFNGKDLTGWKGEGYNIEDDAIVCSRKGRNLITEETFANFVLDFEFKLTPGANNGLGICYPGTGDSAYTGMEIQILDSTAPKYKNLKDYQFHGGLYTMAPAKQGFLKPLGEWNQERVTLIGPSLKVELNGEIILSVDLDEMARLHPKHQGVKRRSGHIGWLGHGDKVWFRNINIGEIPPAANEAGVEPPVSPKSSTAKPSTVGSTRRTPPTGALPTASSPTTEKPAPSTISGPKSPSRISPSSATGAGAAAAR